MFLLIEDNAEEAALIRMAFDSLDSCSTFVLPESRRSEGLPSGSVIYAQRSTHPFRKAVICDLALGESGVEFMVG